MLSHLKRLAVIALFVAAGLILPNIPASAQTPRLEISLSKQYISPATSSGWLTVYLRNPIDSIAGFKIWMQLDRPDLIAFVPSTLPHLAFDTSGSVFSDWGFDVRSITGTLSDVQVVSLVNPPKRGIGPSGNLRTLIRIPYLVLPGADTLPDPTVHILIHTENPFFFNFATPDGSTIPWADSIGGQAVIDTMKIKVRPGSLQFGCVADGDLTGDGYPLSVADLVYTIRVIAGAVDPPDSLYRVDFNGDCVIDSIDQRIYWDYFKCGALCLPPTPVVTCCNPVLKICCQGLAGNVDCDPAGGVDISDLAAIIDNLYLTFTLPCCHGAANIDGDPGRNIDIADLSALIDYLYISFKPPAGCF